MLISLLRSGGLNFYSVLVYVLSVLLLVFLGNPLHECAHGFVAHKLGDNTAKNQGRMTLNPLAHIDYMGALLMLLVGFGWAKPVPVNPRNFKNPKVGMALTALAGPVSNLLAAIVVGFCYNGLVAILVSSNTAVVFGSTVYLAESVSMLKYVLMLFQFLITINITLAVFNFLPIPPLDGSKILMAFLPDRLIYKITRYQFYITIALFILIMAGGVSYVLAPVQSLLYGFIEWLTALPFAGVF